MIGRMRGILIEKKASYLLLEIGGIGYEIEIPLSAFNSSDLSIGCEMVLYTHYVVREDALLLYGFNSINDRDLFRTLIKINGVGPKLGIAILSHMDSAVLAQYIHENNSTALTRLPGVGQKTAHRLIVELRDKMAHWMQTPQEAPTKIIDSKQNTLPEQEAISALVTLGYKIRHATMVIEAMDTVKMNRADIIRAALQKL